MTPYIAHIYIIRTNTYTKGYITQDDIMNGGTLTFEMTSSPNKKRLFNGEDRPYSLTD